MQALVRWSLPILLLATWPAATLGAPLGTAFTYQGQLVQNGTPFTGNATFRFSLWDGLAGGPPPAGGSQVGSSQVLAGVPVTSGLFVVTLNDAGQFGPNAFDGNARWLQVEVCASADCSGTPTVLTPRQPVMPAPYALFSAGPWTISGSNITFNSGNVGIGTTSPSVPLHVAGNARLGSAAPGNVALTIPGPNSPTDMGSFQDLSYAFASAGSARIRAYRGGSWDTYLQFLTTSLNAGLDLPLARMTIDGDGNVGIGSTAPAAKLDVIGDIHLGTAITRYSVPGAEQDVKIVRGEVNPTGPPVNGCCYTVGHPSTGAYDIYFSTPFQDIPTLTASAYSLGYVATVAAFSSAHMRVNITLNGSFADSGFFFTAIGLR